MNNINATMYTEKVLDQSMICYDVRAIFNEFWMRKLDKLDIHSGDIQDLALIVILIGKLYTGQGQTLKCSFVALETLLGWTLKG